MKKIGIFICGEVRSICTLSGCLKAIDNKSGSFKDYDEDLDLKSIIICSECEDKKNDFKDLIKRMKNNEVDTIHFGICAKGCKHKKTDELVKMFEKENIKVVMGTH